MMMETSNRANATIKELRAELADLRQAIRDTNNSRARREMRDEAQDIEILLRERAANGLGKG